MAKYKKSAIKNIEFKSFLDTIDDTKIVYYWKHITVLCDSWIGVITKEKLMSLRNEPHFFNSFLDYDVISKRVKVEKDNQIEFRMDNIESLSNKIPELIMIRDKLVELIKSSPNDIVKAESWLMHSAIKPDLSSDLEATIYFTSKGHCFDNSDVVKEELRIRMNSLIENNTFLILEDNNVLQRAVKKEILIPEATEILYQNRSLPRLLYYYDNEDDFIDSTFIRAVDKLCLTGFEQWIESYIKDIEQAYTYINKRDLVLYLFQICRSDYILRSANKASIEILLHSLSVGEVETEKPWKVSWFSRNAKDPLYVDFYRIACVIVFTWARIKPSSLNQRIFNNAIQVIFESQLSDGSWPLTSNKTNGDIITTCLGIYALAIAKPNNWKKTAQKAKEWLLSNINEVGCWYIQGGPMTYINTFCLESILIVDESDKASFKIPEAGFELVKEYDQNVIDYSLTIVFCEGSLDEGPMFQFDAECYSRIFSNEFPNTKFISIGNCHEVINDSNMIIKSITRLLPKYHLVKLIDRDDRSDDEIVKLCSQDESIRVLEMRSIENYVFDDEVIRKYCEVNGYPEKFDEIIVSKQKAIQESVARGNPTDDIKSAAGIYYNNIKRILGLTRSGSNFFGFMLHSLVPLITSDLTIYQKLKETIFKKSTI